MNRYFTVDEKSWVGKKYGVSANLGLFCAVNLALPLIFGVLIKFDAGDPFEQLIEVGLLAGLFGFTYALYSLDAVATLSLLLPIDTFPLVGLVTCGGGCCWW